MHILLLDSIAELLIEHNSLLKIPLRQRAKFEGWLKFELAFKLEKAGMVNVTVESKKYYSRARPDITFFANTDFNKIYSVELKTPNTNWKCSGISSLSKPITKNINSIISDAKKLNSPQGIIAFVLFPIPCGDTRWHHYIERIVKETGIAINKEKNCRLVQFNIDQTNKCDILICVFMSKHFNN